MQSVTVKTLRKQARYYTCFCNLYSAPHTSYSLCTSIANKHLQCPAFRLAPTNTLLFQRRKSPEPTFIGQVGARYQMANIAVSIIFCRRSLWQCSSFLLWSKSCHRVQCATRHGTILPTVAAVASVQCLVQQSRSLAYSEHLTAQETHTRLCSLRLQW